MELQSSAIQGCRGWRANWPAVLEMDWVSFWDAAEPTITETKQLAGIRLGDGRSGSGGPSGLLRRSTRIMDAFEVAGMARCAKSQ